MFTLPSTIAALSSSVIRWYLSHESLPAWKLAVAQLEVEHLEHFLSTWCCSLGLDIERPGAACCVCDWAMAFAFESSFAPPLASYYLIVYRFVLLVQPTVPPVYGTGCFKKTTLPLIRTCIHPNQEQLYVTRSIHKPFWFWSLIPLGFPVNGNAI